MEIKEHLEVGLTRLVVITEIECKGAGAKQKDDDERRAQKEKGRK